MRLLGSPRSTASSVAASLCPLLAPVLLSLLPSTALACAVCGSSQSEENQTAYLVTTGFLTFLPLIGVGLIVLWIRKRVRELEAVPLVTDDRVGLAIAPSPDE